MTDRSNWTAEDIARTRCVNLVGWTNAVKLAALEDLTFVEMIEWLEMLAEDAGQTLRAYCTANYSGSMRGGFHGSIL